MKFTALEEYGLRCILHLARQDPQEGHAEEAPPGNGSLTLGEIADREGLTQQYAGKIFRILARAGLVESARGRKGGYRLTRPSEEITVSDALTALDGRFFDRKICGRYTGNREECVHTANCTVRLVWFEVQRVLDEVLKKRTLKDLVVTERKMEKARQGLPQGLGPATLSEDVAEGPADNSVHEGVENTPDKAEPVTRQGVAD